MDTKYIQILVLSSVFGLLYFFEHIHAQIKEINDWKNERFNLAVGVFNLVLSFIPASFFVQWVALIQDRNLGLLNQFALPFWLQVFSSVLILDFWMYVWHRLNHRVPVLWRLHKFHHRDEKMNSTTALRFHILELYLSYPGKAVVCLVFGIDFLPLLIYEILFFAAVVAHHSNIYISERADRLYRLLFASPMMHRIHHSDRKEETHSNFGALLSIWDRLFLSWREKSDHAISFGLPNDQ